MVQYIRLLAKLFYREALFVVPYCKATVLVGGCKRCPRVCLSPGYRLSIPHPWVTSSPTISTCAPGAVRHPTTAAILAHCLVVFSLTVLGHCLYRHAPTATSGEKHPPIHLHTRQSWCLTLRTSLKERILACRAAPEPMHLRSERQPGRPAVIDPYGYRIQPVVFAPCGPHIRLEQVLFS
jgi:hypothetical protein